jgi:hypothetical protein
MAQHFIARRDNHLVDGHAGGWIDSIVSDLQGECPSLLASRIPIMT